MIPPDERGIEAARQALTDYQFAAARAEVDRHIVGSARAVLANLFADGPGSSPEFQVQLTPGYDALQMIKKHEPISSDATGS